MRDVEKCERKQKCHGKRMKKVQKCLQALKKTVFYDIILIKIASAQFFCFAEADVRV